MSGSPDLVQQEGSEAAFKTPRVIERQQEEMLKSKYPNLNPRGGSNFLLKKMQQTKYFDSGDYNMARAKMSSKQDRQHEMKQLVNEVTGDHMPTPDEIPRVRKTSQSNLVG